MPSASLNLVTRPVRVRAFLRCWGDFLLNDVPRSTAGLTVAEDEALSTLGFAQVFARLSTALADALIVSHDAKYDYRLWRPFKAIQLGDIDGNPATAGDPNWTGQSIGQRVLAARAFAAPVPEPSTWAMMLGGFAMIGFALRRQRARAGSPPVSRKLQGWVGVRFRKRQS